MRDGRGVLATPYSPSAPLSPTDLGDIAEVSARMHAEPGHGHASYELAGPQELTQLDMARILAAVHGIPVAVEVVALERALAPRLTLSQRADYTAMYAHYDEGGFVGCPTVLAALLGRAPTTFEAAATRDLAAAGASTSQARTGANA
jgi:NAD(P)H dehydrogenase (quinone)